MYLKRLCILLSLWMLSVGVVSAQESRRELRTEICINFRLNSATIDTAYLDNAARIRDMVEFMREINSNNRIEIKEVMFGGAASPEGSDQYNRKLAGQRLHALEKVIRSQVNIPDEIVTYNDSYIPWDYLKAQIAKSDDVPNKNRVLSILNEPVSYESFYKDLYIDSRVYKIKRIDGNRTWKVLDRMFFRRMRGACSIFVTYEEIPEEPAVVAQEPVVETKQQQVAPEPEPVQQATEPEPEPVDEWVRRLHVKTNAAGWAIGMMNAAVEIDIAQHFSFTLPVYYSDWNYFKSTLKFRTFAIQPEFRYWPSKENRGFFAGAHLGFGYYNFALDGGYRYQDRNGKTPTVGGGVAVGYRLPISKNQRWSVEFAVGAGVYPLEYDVFHNGKNGLQVETVKRTYIGLDQVAITFGYAFDLKKKGGKR